MTHYVKCWQWEWASYIITLFGMRAMEMIVVFFMDHLGSNTNMIQQAMIQGTIIKIALDQHLYSRVFFKVVFCQKQWGHRYILFRISQRWWRNNLFNCCGLFDHYNNLDNILDLNFAVQWNNKFLVDVCALWAPLVSLVSGNKATNQNDQNQNGHKHKWPQTGTATNRNGHKPEWPQGKTATNRNSHRP